jgi:hypothetical protein
MLQRELLLITFVKLVDCIPTGEAKRARQRGRPKIYEDRLMVKALVIMIIRPELDSRNLGQSHMSKTVLRRSWSLSTR